MKASGRSLFAAIRGRSYASQAATKQAERPLLAKQDAKLTRLPNGMIVASVENNSPVSRIAVFYNAGPRFEGNDSGITHAVRSAASLSSTQATAFGISRNIQQIGGNLQCTSTREHMIYSVECTRNNLETGVEQLSYVTTSPAFKPWEVKELDSRLQLDLAILQQQPEIRLIEALHRASFRNTLGNSLYTPDYCIGSYSAEQLAEFVSSNYISGNMSIVGVGVDQEDLLQFVKKYFNKVGSGNGPSIEKAKFHGDEVRINAPGSLIHASIASEGLSLGDSKLMAQGVLMHLLGTGPHVKYGLNNATSKLGQAAAANTSGPFSATAISASYSDSGLFGFQVIAPAADASKVLQAMVDATNKTTEQKIQDADVARAKKQLKVAMASRMEDQSVILQYMGISSLLGGQVLSYNDLEAAIDKVTVADVEEVAKKVITGKPAMAVVGNLKNTPYLDQLLKVDFTNTTHSHGIQC
ncbi:Cytochrome b-c1 complex subunit 2, mitochondrial [Lamellibrachia satsuma]|nr:Cytochrome b-c1 complex subunit 2, mitochondrial [Lamellibrachia satsuma]